MHYHGIRREELCLAARSRSPKPPRGDAFSGEGKARQDPLYPSASGTAQRLIADYVEALKRGGVSGDLALDAPLFPPCAQ